MIRILRAGQAEFEQPQIGEAGWKLPGTTVWIDLLHPTREEELAVERALGAQLPTREEMAEIEASSRLYQEDGATFMTATLLHRSAEHDVAGSGPITFVLVDDRLVTIRYFEPKSFPNFASQIERQPELCSSGTMTFVNLMEAIVDRTADNLEFTSGEVEALSQTIFGRQRPKDFAPILNRLGVNQTSNNKVRDSLVSLSRLISFAGFADQVEAHPEARGHLESLQRDIQSLTDHSSHLSSNITFLLDAALGLINIEQNGIMKTFSLISAVIMPPTLIGAVYGMNFVHMPELKWMSGYPLALMLMLVSAVSPLIYFRRRGWI